MKSRCLDSILWRRLDTPGHDFAELVELEGGFLLSGTANFLHGGKGCSLRYAVRCNGSWETETVRIAGTNGRKSIDLDISSTSDRLWTMNGKAQPQVEGCIDIDLAFTPATNLLPIRRLRLRPGQSADTVAAWLVFPKLGLQKLPQTYQRRDTASYSYSSDSGSFKAILAIRRSGFVEIYSNLWRRERGA